MSRAFLLSMIALLVISAGCAAPDPAQPTETQPTPTPTTVDDAPASPPGHTATTPDAPPFGLHVQHVDASGAEVAVRNGFDIAIDVSRAAFTFTDAQGNAWTADNASTDAQATAFPATQTLEPNATSTGTLAFAVAAVNTPLTLRYDDGIHRATFVLVVGDFMATLPAGRNTSLGSPIMMPANGFVAFKIKDATSDVSACVIDEGQHAAWYGNASPEGYACRSGLDSEGSALLPPGEYNIGMACPGETECRFSLTFTAVW